MDHGNSPTLDSGAATLRAAVSELPGPQLEDLVRLDRYEVGPMIGKGGMGEVRQSRDVRLNRHIALKTATTRNKAELSRFIREAQVQGQLEHPSIVPVYELGVGADGAPYFAMKRVRGESLFDVLNLLAAGDAEARNRYPRRKLLQAFVSVCQAVDYAHVNGWLHRDLKPANVMLGDFGEVYVLDWGLARRIDARDEEERDGTQALAPIGLTTPGALMGTPGYMSPEQVLGQPADQRSDVYALGAILFELLTHQMLAKGSTTMELLIDTRQGCDANARVRAPHADVPPELEAICVKATALKASERHATVRELHEAVDRVLAGERDLELRAGLAHQHAEAAEKASALAASDRANELEHRKTALREVGLALALDPTYRPAMQTLVDLMQHPPKTMPAETQAELDETVSEGIRGASRSSFLAYMTVFLGMLTITSMHPSSAWCYASAGLFLLAALATVRAGYLVRRPTSITALPALLLSNAAIASLFFIDGPLTVLPAFAAANTLSYRIAMDGRWRRLVVGLGLAVVVLPFVASWAGLLPESFRFTAEGLLLVPTGVPFDYRHTTMMLLFGFIATIGISALVVGRVQGSNTELARARAMQAWNLAQLLPPEASPKPKVVEADEGPMCVVQALVRPEATGGY